MEDSFAEQQTFFARVNDSIVWADRERVKTMIIDLYEHYECLWNVKSAGYKNVTITRRAKEDIRKHFGLTDVHFFRYVVQVDAEFYVKFTKSTLFCIWV